MYVENNHLVAQGCAVDGVRRNDAGVPEWLDSDKAGVREHVAGHVHGRHIGRDHLYLSEPSEQGQQAESVTRRPHCGSGASPAHSPRTCLQETEEGQQITLPALGEGTGRVPRPGAIHGRGQAQGDEQSAVGRALTVHDQAGLVAHSAAECGHEDTGRVPCVHISQGQCSRPARPSAARLACDALACSMAHRRVCMCSGIRMQ